MNRIEHCNNVKCYAAQQIAVDLVKITAFIEYAFLSSSDTCRKIALLLFTALKFSTQWVPFSLLYQKDNWHNYLTGIANSYLKKIIMWIPITDCGKQITDHSRLREPASQQEKLYEVVEVEFDQYKLRLLTINNQPAEKVELVLSCDQLLQYHFEIENDHL